MRRVGLFDLEKHFAFYGAHHSNPVTVVIHVLFVWSIFFTALLILYFTPSFFNISNTEFSLLGNDVTFVWNVGFLVTLIYAAFYASLDLKAGSLAAFLCMSCWVGSSFVATLLGFSLAWKVVLVAQLVYWTGQFIGHGAFEKRAPALLDNLVQAFVMAPFFVLLEALQTLFNYEPYPGFRSRVEAKIEADINEWKENKQKPIRSSNATNSPSDYKAVLEKFHPPRPDWYEEFYAWVLNSAMGSYEAEVARYKSQVFSNLRGKAQKILEIGIGTGPNLKYYASDSDVQVIGIDPIQKMEKYARSSAESAGLPLSNFEFIHAVGEVIPLHDASVDVVVGTLVLCSVKNVNVTLKEVKRVLRPGGLYVFVEHVAAKDGTLLRFVQRILDPLQQTIADGCHLSRETGNSIYNAGFSSVELDTAFVSRAAYTNPHVYGIACK